MRMAQTEAEREAESVRRKSAFRIKRLIFFIPLSMTLVLLAVCIFLGIRLHRVTKELQSVLSRADITSDIKEETAFSAGSGYTAGTSPYTVSGVDESRRKPSDVSASQAQEEEGEIRRVYLTFDDGPSTNTGRILDILAEYDVKASFFVVGKEKEEYQPLYKRIVDEGHTLAMHSYSHKYDEIYQSVESYSDDLSRLQEFLYETTGVWCRYCRFPGGSSNQVSRVDMHDLIAYLDEQDISYFDWNVSSGDASSAYISPENIIRNSTAQLRKYQEAIILMHDAAEKKSTVEALPGLIETIQAMEDTKIVPITDDTEPIHHISND